MGAFCLQKCCSSCQVAVRGSLFSENRATTGGAVGIEDNSYIVLADSNLHANQALHGGAVAAVHGAQVCWTEWSRVTIGTGSYLHNILQKTYFGVCNKRSLKTT